MKKKYLIVYCVILLFLGINVASAKNECSLQDEKEWKYETTLYDNSAESTITAKTYDHYKCCTNSSGSKACDFYSKVAAVTNETGNGQETNENSSVNYCSGLNSTFVFIGHIVALAKILIPIIIIGFGMLDFFKAVTGSKDDEIKKSLKSLIMRSIAGVCIFFLPAVIGLIFSWVDGWASQYEGKTNECLKCIWNVRECTK